MRPNFALSLSYSGIQLLQRQAAGWGRVGDVDIGSADLAGDLAALKDKAIALGNGPVETKLIIPDDQIKYLTVDATGLDKDALQVAVLSALDGATPYPVDELEFDFANETDRVYVAAVAKETLQEAEAFATEHGFKPIGFVAAPPSDLFPKEPNFGLSASAKSSGVVALESDSILAIATGEAVATQPIVEPEPVLDEVATTSPLVAKIGSAPVTQPPPSILPGFSSRRAEPVKQGVDSVQADAPTGSIETPAPLSPRLEGVQRDVGSQHLPVAPVAVSAPTLGDNTNSPRITGLSEAALNESDIGATLSAMRPGAAEDFDDDLPQTPAGFAAPPRVSHSFHGAADGAPAANLRAPQGASDTSTEAVEKPKSNGASVATKTAALASSAGGAAIAGVQQVLAKRALAKSNSKKPETEVEVVAQDEKDRMTVFGARKSKKKKAAIPVGGKPRFLGLILTAILLLFLVTVAAWASVFLDEGLARFFGGTDRDTAIAELSVPDEGPNEEELVELASLESGEGDIATGELPFTQEALAQVEPSPPLVSPEEAAAKYAATGIWLATPIQPASPPKISLDDIYSASIDTRIIGQDAFALAPLNRPRDFLPSGFSAPTPTGSDLADSDLIAATPDGVLTPEGALVFLGRPSRVPPAVPERLRTAALTPEDAPTADETENLPTASLRPKVRPSGLVENAERTQLGGNSRAELSKLRPKLRPKVAKEIEETQAAEAPTTRLAVASSRVPSVRPRNFARIVSRAQKKAQQQAEQQTTQVAAVAPRSVTPRIPSRTSVAKSATVKNAINLSRVNLIGVYGKPSSRRALVRLSSGRYKKVKVGDRVDGGRVSAIGEGQLIYTKSGRNVTLRMPKS
jgi:hypothetical protein